MKHQNYLIGLAISLLTAIVCIPIIVGAAPASAPPTGVTDAKFNSIGVGSAGTEFIVNSSGDISNGNMNPVKISDQQGLNVERDIVNNRTLVTDAGTCAGMAGYYNLGTCYLPVRISDGLDVSGVAGLQNSSSNYGVLISDPDGLDVRSSIGNYTAGNVPLKIRDDHGVEFANYAGTVGLRVAANGDISDDGGDVVVGDNFSVTGRTELSATTDASGTAGTGVLEIGGGLRMDGNEIITNTNSTLYLQNDNNGDFRVDSTTLYVDSSANRVGIGDTTPSYPLDVVGDARVTGRLRADTVGGYGWASEQAYSVADGGNITIIGECPENDEVAAACGFETRYFNSTSGCLTTVAKSGAALDVVVLKKTAQWDYSSPGKCEITFKNNTGFTRCGVLFTQCFNPND